MKKPKKPSFIVIGILTVITIISWVLFEVYQALTTNPPLNIPPEILDPIFPSLNTQALDKIQKAVFFEDEQIVPITLSTATITPTPMPTGELSPTPTETKELEESPEEVSTEEETLLEELP